MGQAKRRGTKEERVKQAMEMMDEMFSQGEKPCCIHRED